MEEQVSPISFYQWLQRRRKTLDLTQDELAQRVGCSIGALRKIEQGERRPSKQLAELLAKALEISNENQPEFIRFARGELSRVRLRQPPQQLLTVPSGLRDNLQTQPATPSEIQLKSPALSSHMPLPITPLVGRETELAALDRLLQDPQCRLLTLTGMGGIGKTRLAIEIANRELNLFPGGAFYFPFTPVDSLEKIIAAIADVLDFSFSGLADPQEQLLDYISTHIAQKTLFIFDNLEHLLALAPRQADACGLVELVAEILQRTPNLMILGTSRERMNISGEWTYELHGLSLPPADFSGNLEDCEATALFIQSAQRINFGVQISTDERQSIIQICRLVAGVPLAIELAAAWVGLLSCREIAQEIQSNLDFLTARLRDIPERHRSIRATFDHSWKLISEQERWVLCQLSVFHGSFDRQAGYQIAGASLPLLASLIAKSLVRRAESGRYDLHEVIQQYAFAHLQEDPRCLATHQRHSVYYLGILHEQESSFRSASQQEAYERLTGEIDNIRAAWVWAIEHEHYEQLVQAGRAFGWYYEVSGLHQQGIEQFEMLITALTTKPLRHRNDQLLALALISQALLYFRRGDPNKAQNLYRESIDILRTTGDQTLLADALIFSGIILHLKGEYQEAISSLREGLELARAGDQFWFEAYAIYNLGYIDSLLGRYNQGLEQMLAGVSTWRRLGDPHYIALGLNFLTPTLLSLGRIAEARANIQESISLCEHSKNRWGLGIAYRYMGAIMTASGDVSQAKIHILNSLEIYSGNFTGWDFATSLVFLGDASMLDENTREAKKNYLDALRLAFNIHAAPVALSALIGLAALQAQTGRAAQALGLCSAILKHTASDLEIKTRAEQLKAALEPLLSPAQVKELQSIAAVKSFDSIVNEMLDADDE